MSGRPCFRFAEFTLSPARRLLLREGRPVPLIPRYLDLLVVLVERRAEALHRRELLDAVWADVVVSEGALTQAVRTLRRTLEADGPGRDFIRTVSRHGYQFVHPVAEEAETGSAPATEAETEAAAPPPLAHPTAADPFAAPLTRLLDEGARDEERREAAETLHALGTAEVLARLPRDGSGARAWATLRDTRWNVAGAGAVPLRSAPGGARAWLELVRARLRQARRLAAERWAAASAGGAVAGLLAGCAGGLVLAALRPEPFDAALLATLMLVGGLIGGLGAAGVGCGLAAAEALVRSRRTLALVALGAVGGGLIGAVAQRLARSVLAAITGRDVVPIGGGFEGLVIGAAAGLAYGWATPRAQGGMATPHGSRRAWAVLLTGLACSAAAALLTLAGGTLGGASLHRWAEAFPGSRLRLDVLGPLVGEPGFGPATRAAVGTWEGLLFGAGLALGLTRRPKPRSLSDS
jgi:DNA-binding winged helix-turn-helix (wHTH) protein